MRNILLRLKYDGYEFKGWQKQDGEATVQGSIEETISFILKERTELKGCSRTDSGVHALDYYAVFKTESSIPINVLPKLLNSALPSSIEVLSAFTVPLDFNPRYRACKKTYEYIISDSFSNDVFSARHKWLVNEFLDVKKMNQASQLILGKHDFKAFRKSSRDDMNKSSIREIFDISVSKRDSDILISVTGDAFLYNMVRIIVGTLYEIGIGKKEPEVFLKAINQLDRSLLGLTAPASGLYLKRIYF